MPVFEREARIGGIVSIDGVFDRLHILYPGLDLSLRHDEVMRRNLRAGSTRAVRIKSPARECERQDSVGGHQGLSILGKVTGLSLARAATSWNPTVYVNVRCALQDWPPEGETVIMLRLQHAEMLDLKLYDTILISLSDKYAKTLE